MAKIIFLPDEDGNKRALKFIEEIRKKSMEGNKYYEELVIYILRALDHLQLHGINELNPDTFLTTTKHGGTGVITFQLTKPLKHHPPLWEMRVNLRPAAFRAIFFPFIRENNTQVIFIIDAMLKSQTSSPAFEKRIKESKEIVQSFFANPKKYVGREMNVRPRQKSE